MTRPDPARCAAPIEFEKLVAYWLGELPEPVEAPIEEHLFGCAHCTRRMEELAALSAGVRAAVHGGRVHLVMSPAFLETMKRAGMRLREYRVEPGGSVNCTIRPEDDAVVSRMRAPLAGVKRLDVVQRLRVGEADETEVRLEDVPFDPDSGEVLSVPPAAWVRAMPANTLRTRLIAVGEAGERLVGEYTFVHTPS
jgi:anti-sigma factor RsiW